MSPERSESKPRVEIDRDTACTRSSPSLEYAKFAGTEQVGKVRGFKEMFIVNIKRCQGLKNTELLGKPDPYGQSQTHLACSSK